MNFRNVLAALGFIGIIPALWILDGAGIVSLRPETSGAAIVVWTLIAQFYFRKKEES